MTTLLDTINDIEAKEKTARLTESIPDVVEEALEEVMHETEAEFEEEIDDTPEEEPSATAFNKKRREIRDLKKSREEADHLNQELRERLARLEGRVEERTASSIAVEPSLPQEPDPTYEPEAWTRYKIAQLEQQNSHTLQKQQETLQRLERDAAIRGARAEVAAYEAKYSAKHSDYADAKAYFRKTLEAEISMQQPHLSPSLLSNVIDEQELRLAALAEQQKANPAEYFVKLAEIRGYSPKKATVSASAPAGSNLDAIRRNKSKAANMEGASSRSTGNGVLTSHQINKMSLAEIAPHLGKDWGKIR